jgi:hypothetical protein
MLIRFLALFFLSDTGTAGLFEVAFIYVGYAAAVDLVLLR